MRAFTLGDDACEVDGLVRSPPLSFLRLRELSVLHERRVWSTLTVTTAEKTATLRGLNRVEAPQFIALASTAIKTSLTAAGTRRRADLQHLSRELTQRAGRFFAGASWIAVMLGEGGLWQTLKDIVERSVRPRRRASG
jgi:hypothetical protein